MQLFPIFRRAFPHVFFEFLVEIIHVFVTDPFGDLIYFKTFIRQKLFGVPDAHTVQIGIKAFAHFFCKEFPKVSTVVSEKRGNGFQFQVIHIIVINIMQHVIHDVFTGRAADGVHTHFKLTFQKLQDLVEIGFSVNGINDGGIGGKRYGNISINLRDLLFDLQININEKTLDGRNAVCAVKKFFSNLMELFFHTAVIPCLNVICQERGVLLCVSICYMIEKVFG